jgi:uncharacterized protein
MIYILIDANFLLLPAQFKVDIYTQMQQILPETGEIIVYQAVLRELEYKVQTNPEKLQFQHEFHLAKQLLGAHSHQIDPALNSKGQTVDDFLLDQAIRQKNAGRHVCIATNDMELRKKCRNAEISTIFFRSRKKLVLEK